MGQMAGAIMPQLSNAVARAGFQQQLGQASNQMYQPPNQMGGYDPYTAMRRPNYMPYGPNQQFYQPIYQPSYSQFSNFGYGQAPFGGFYQPPMQQFQPMMPPQQAQQQAYAIPYSNAQQGSSGFFKRRLSGAFDNRRNQSAPPLADNYGQPMLSPQPMQTQYRPIPMASQTSIDQIKAQAMAEGVNQGMSQAQSSYGGGAKAGGKVDDDGIASLLKK